MPVKTAMKSAMGTESTPNRRIWMASSGSQVPTSASARPASILRRPTCAMKPSRMVARDATEGDTAGKLSGEAGKRGGGSLQRGRREAGRQGGNNICSRPSAPEPTLKGWLRWLPRFPASPLPRLHAAKLAKARPTSPSRSRFRARSRSWRTRSRVTPSMLPISSRVCSRPPSRPK